MAPCLSPSRQATGLLCPLQDLLALLHAQGPSTEGIFRLAAGEHAWREVREALDRGVEVQLESQPVHLLAAVLKQQCSKAHPQPSALQDFLRKIPSKLLQAELYGEWMSALQKSSRQERLAGLKEVASKLPQANLLLLKRLLALLHNISSNAAASRMTAANLAICVGPNLLSPAEEHTLPLDMLLQVTEQVTRLVEFLIDHQGELFEEEQVTGLEAAEAEEVAAARPGELEAGEVPPVAPASTEPKSSSGHRRSPKASGDTRQCSCRKRKLSCKEERDSQPGNKRQKLEGDPKLEEIPAETSPLGLSSQISEWHTGHSSEHKGSCFSLALY
ncbi:T-cell activation Rho GTPase-activating protein-like [Indicator indicator]|uniref:T-cell activation Rho GTPase-activating protein-like n=1 Tax=Indicator indicator TaxID=1002788 RepID=UPI0023DF2F79|nr:T-cell activation Rho GTPase-activating protein-like [Indicator indicator]